MIDPERDPLNVSAEDFMALEEFAYREGLELEELLDEALERLASVAEVAAENMENGKSETDVLMQLDGNNYKKLSIIEYLTRPSNPMISKPEDSLHELGIIDPFSDEEVVHILPYVASPEKLVRLAEFYNASSFAVVLTCAIQLHWLTQEHGRMGRAVLVETYDPIEFYRLT